MRKELSILTILTVHLPEIQQALGGRWPDLADQLRAQASDFENLADEGALAGAVNQLLGLFMMNEVAHEILTRPELTGVRQPRPKAEAELTLETIANRFYDLCTKPDAIVEHTHKSRSPSKSHRTPLQRKSSSSEMNDHD